MASDHVPVLTDQVVEWLAPAAPGLLVDATLGLAGHASALLDAAPGFHLLGVDRDPRAVAEARRRLEPYGRRVTVVNTSFDREPEIRSPGRGSRTVSGVDPSIRHHIGEQGASPPTTAVSRRSSDR